MDRPYATYSRTSTTARNAGATSTRDRRRGGFTDVETDMGNGAETNIVDGGATYRRRAESGYGYRSGVGYDYRTGSGYDRSDEVRDYDSYGSYGGYGSRRDADDLVDDDVDLDDDIYEYEDPIDRRWIWVAGVAAAILLIAVICTVVILGGGDSGPVSKTIAATTPATTAQDAVTSPITKAPLIVTSTAPPPAAVAPLSPETVTTVPPSPTDSVAPAPAPAVPVPAASPRTVTYQVTGNRPLLDLVTVVYTDGQGALQTQFNVALPWVRSVTLDPGVELTSVTATSLTGQLNCSVTDSTGATLVAQNTNSMIATCTR